MESDVFCQHTRTRKNPISNLKSEEELQQLFRSLWRRADEIWDRHDGESAFDSYVSADYLAVYHELKLLQPQAETFLEWGSGLGVVAIMADLMGFRSYGIEAESMLADYSLDLADEFDSDVQLVCGSFIPDGFEWNPASGDESVKTFIDVADGYSKLDLELDDFDLIYAYPWPTEHALYRNVLRQFGRPGVMLLSYDAREGIGTTIVQ